MSFHLHVFNLRGDATNLDIRQLFTGLAIQHDGVIIVGGPKGEAFVTFDSESDLLRAMQKNGEQHLNFKIATEIDRLRGVNRMCMANLQKLGEAGSDIVQTPKSQPANIGDYGKRSKSVDPSDSDNNYPYDLKRRRTAGNDHIDSCFDKQRPIEYTESYSLPKRDQPPWASLRHQINPGSNSSPQTRPVPTANQLQEGTVYPSNSRSVEFPYPPSERPHPDDHQPQAGSYPPPAGPYPPPAGPYPPPAGPYPPPARQFSPPARPFSPPARSFSPPARQFSPPEGPHPPPRRPFPPPGGPHPPPGGPYPPPAGPYPPPAGPYPPPPRPLPLGPRYPYNPRFQAGKRLNPAALGPMPEQKSDPKPSSIPIDGSLLMSLLPTSKQQKYCIQLSELPPDVTSDLVWSWVGGPAGAALGVILLKPTNDYAVALLIYDNPYDRDQRLEFSEINAKKFSMADACDIITNFIYNWTMWKGPRREHSPIFETTLAGGERYVDHRTFYDFAKKSLTPPGKPNEDPYAKNVKKSLMLPHKPNADPFVKRVVPIPKVAMKSQAQEPSTTEPNIKKFLLVYNLDPAITATEVQSWFDDALTTLKINFPDKNGPKDSEAIAYVLFANINAYRKAVSELDNEKVVAFDRRSYGGSYDTMRKYGDECTMTESSSSGDRLISPEERKRPPFIVEAEPFTLVNSLNLRYICLKGIPSSITSAVVWSWFPHAKGFFILKYMDKRLGIFVAFESPASVSKSLSNLKTGKFGKPKFQSLVNLTSTEAMRRCYSCAEIKISTGRKQPDRKITAEEAKFIIRQMPQTSAPDPQIVVAKSHATPEEKASFLYHLNTIEGVGENEALCLMLYDMKRKITACDIHALFPDALCVLKVNFDADSFGPRKAVGYLLFEDIQVRLAAKMLFEQHAEKWRNTMKVPGFVSKRSNRFKLLQGQSVQQSLAPICPKSTVSESSPSGVDRVLCAEELSMATINSSLIVHDPPCLHYAQLTEFDEGRSAGEIWDCLGGRSHVTDIKGVVLLISKTDLKSCIAFVAFITLEKRDKLADSNEQEFTKWWPTVLKMTERQVFGFISGSSDDYIIKVSTVAGPDRDLDPAEQEHLGIATKIEPAPKEADADPNRNSAEQERLDTATKMKSVPKESSSMAASKAIASKDISHRFYIRLKKVPADVTTACGLLSMYTCEGGPGRSATLVRDCDGVSESAYVMFDEAKDRDSALSVYPFSIQCTAQGRAVRLAEFEPEYEILESTESGEDRVMSVEERDGLEEAVQSMEITL